MKYPVERLRGHVGKPAWPLHHKGTIVRGVCIPLEFLTEPIQNRVRYVREEKPEHEIPTRLAAMRLVKGKLPAAVIEAQKVLVEAGRACDEAQKACVEAGRAYVEAWRAYVEGGKAYYEARRVYVEARRACAEAREARDEAIYRHRDEIMALFAKECPDVKWDMATGLVFPKESA